MKHFLFIFATAYLCINSTNSFGMQQNAAQGQEPVIIKEAHTIFSVAYISDGKKEMLALGNDTGCFFINLPVTKDYIIEELHVHPTHNIITSADKKKIGTFARVKKTDTLYDNIFFVHDVLTKKIIWSHLIAGGNAHSEDFTYSAAFSQLDDTIFVCHEEQLISNKNRRINLPFIGKNNHFAIACHPKLNSILYPSGDNTLSLKSLNNLNITLRFNPDIPKGDAIRLIKYSPDGTSIGLLTDNHKIFIYNPKDNSTDCPSFNGNCYNFIFLPFSSTIMVLSDCFLQYYNIKSKTCEQLRNVDPSHKDNLFTNILDTSYHGTQCIFLIDAFFATEKIPLEIIEKIPFEDMFPLYCALKNYSDLFLPEDIIRVITQKLLILENIKN